MTPPDREPAPTRQSEARSLAFGAFRLVVVPAALIWVLSRVTGLNWTPSGLASPTALLLGLVVNQIALGVFALRMQLVLRLFGVRIGWWPALRIHLQSMFYFFALPMTVGLEIARYVKIRAIQPSASVVQMSSALLLDRLLGAGSALAVAVLCLPFVRAAISVDVPLWAWIAGLVGAALLSLAAWLWPRSRRLMQDALRLASGRWLGLAGLFVLSMGMHTIFAAGVQLTAVALGLQVTLLETLFAVAGGLLLVAIPVSLGGLGPAEAGSAGLFVAMGQPTSVALVAGALPYLLRLVCALEGAAWELVESGSATLAATRRLILQRQSS